METASSLKYLKYLVLMVAAIFLVMFLNQIDFEVLIRDMDRMGSSLIWMLFISFIAYLLSSLGWMLSVNALFDLSKFKSYFWTRQLGETLGTLNPTGIVGGDALRIHLIRKTGVSKNLGLSSVITSRALLWLSYLLVTLLGLVMFMLIYKIFELPMLLLGLLLIGLFILLSKLLFSKHALSKLTMGVVKMTGKKSWMTKAEGFQKYNETISRLWVDRKMQVYLAIICFSLHYACGAWEFQYILTSLGEEISFSSAMMLEVGTSFVRSLMSIVPGQLGIEEYSNKYFLAQLGVQNETVWISVSLIRRFRQLFWIVISAIVYFLWYQGDVKNSSTDNL